eukprot:9489750-Pyramimonas_sp.AAC.1
MLVFQQPFVMCALNTSGHTPCLVCSRQHLLGVKEIMRFKPAECRQQLSTSRLNGPVSLVIVMLALRMSCWVSHLFRAVAGAGQLGSAELFNGCYFNMYGDFTRYLFIKRLPPLDQVVDFPRAVLLPPKTRRAPRITLVRERIPDVMTSAFFTCFA